MSSRTLKMILENWADGLAGFDEAEADLPFDVESFCRQMDAELSKHDWISVVERLPEKGEQVIFGNWYNGEWIWIASGEYGKRGCRIDFDDEWLDSVRANGGTYESFTHWKPMPEPPK